MSAALLALIALLALTAASFAAGHLRGARGRIAGWALLALAVAAADRLTAAQPPGVRMLAVIAALFVPLKALVTSESGVRLPPARWLAFCLLWPGMRIEPFAAPAPHALPGADALLRHGCRRLAQGLALVLAARLAWTATRSHLLATLLLLPGLSLALHFGVFNLLAGAWRRAGRDVTALFDAPLAATSLDEFWSRRWNHAFSEFTARVIYRPLSACAGRPVALVASFLASGLAHELAISAPVRAGWGGPFAYFALHAALVAGERAGRWRPGVLVPLVAPLPLLFHRAFLAGCVWPLIGISG